MIDLELQQTVNESTWRDARWLEIDANIIAKALAAGDWKSADQHLEILERRVERLREMRWEA